MEIKFQLDNTIPIVFVIVGLITCIGFVIKMHYRQEKFEEKVDGKIVEVEKKLTAGDNAFKEIDKEIKGISTMLTKIETQITMYFDERFKK